MEEKEVASESTLIVARIGGRMVNVSQPGTDTDLPELQKMLSPDFKLASDHDAKTLQQAFDVVYPITGAFDQRDDKFRRTGNRWTLVRGHFFKKSSGYVLETDPKGTIVAVKYSLEL